LDHATKAAATGVVVRPLFRNLVNRYAVSLGLLFVPPFAALYALTAQGGDWMYIVLVQAVITVAAFVLIQAVQRVKIVIVEDGFVETPLLTRPVHIPRSAMSSIRIVPVTDGNSAQFHNQLFLQDSEGVTLMRMRGRIWGNEAVDRVAGVFDLPVVRDDVPKVMAELRKDPLVQLYWFERHPYMWAIGMAAIAVAVFAPVLTLIESLINVGS
jgi:hypothetical protein